MNQNEIKEINLTIRPNKDVVNVKVLNKSNTSTIFSISPNTLTSLFGTSYNSGYLPVNGDGVVFIESREEKKLVVIQRGHRSNQRISWGRSEETLCSPNAFFFWMLEPQGSNFRRIKERIYLSTGPSRGPDTPLYTGRWMGNVYSTPTHDSTNICWGTTAVSPGGEVTISSLLNIANDFFHHPFSSDLGGSLSAWNTFSETKTFTLNRAGTVQNQIDRMWNNEAY